MQAFAVTHQGLVRENNEDRFLVRRFEDGSVLLAVADGMGGHAAGEVAAGMAVEAFSEFRPAPERVEAQLVRCVGMAQYRIVEATRRERRLAGMGTTLTAVLLTGSEAFWAHVGDTRLYLFRGKRLIRMTDDHTLPGLLLQRGEISVEEARLHPRRNMLFRCIGCGNAEADSGQFEVEPEDLVMISTDGLHDMVPEEMIAAALLTGPSLQEKLDLLVQAALGAGAPDNITIALAEV